MNALMNTDLQPLKIMQIPKQKYYRSKNLQKSVANLDCQACGSGYMVQAAHSNWSGGKGRGIKASDEHIAALCLKCHYEIDQGHKLSRDERQDLWIKAHQRTVSALVQKGEWPLDIPIPCEQN